MVYNMWEVNGGHVKDRKPRCEMHSGAMMDTIKNHPVSAETQ